MRSQNLTLEMKPNLKIIGEKSEKQIKCFAKHTYMRKVHDEASLVNDEIIEFEGRKLKLTVTALFNVEDLGAI